MELIFQETWDEIEPTYNWDFQESIRVLQVPRAHTPEVLQTIQETQEIFIITFSIVASFFHESQELIDDLCRSIY